MRLILLGPPGAGKGTQAELISNRFAIPKIGTGDMLRTAVSQDTLVGQSVKKIMDEGGLVPEDLIIELVKDRIQQPDCKGGFLFDGFPRTLYQVEAMNKFGIAIDAVIAITLSDEEIIQRMSGRRIHVDSGRVYHVRFNPPKVPGLDDVTGEALIQREDDKEETVRKRLQIYHRQTEPLIEWFKQRPLQYTFYTVSGDDSVENVFNEIMTCLKEDDKYGTHEPNAREF